VDAAVFRFDVEQSGIEHDFRTPKPAENVHTGETAKLYAPGLSYRRGGGKIIQEQHLFTEYQLLNFLKIAYSGYLEGQVLGRKMDAVIFLARLSFYFLKYYLRVFKHSPTYDKNASRIQKLLETPADGSASSAIYSFYYLFLFNC